MSAPHPPSTTPSTSFAGRRTFVVTSTDAADPAPAPDAGESKELSPSVYEDQRAAMAEDGIAGAVEKALSDQIKSATERASVINEEFAKLAGELVGVMDTTHQTMKDMRRNGWREYTGSLASAVVTIDNMAEELTARSNEMSKLGRSINALIEKHRTDIEATKAFLESRTAST